MYIVIEEKKIQQLVEYVNLQEMEGFQPVGGLSHANGMYVQAMHKPTVAAKEPTAKSTDKALYLWDFKNIHTKSEPFDSSNTYTVAYTYKDVEFTFKIPDMLQGLDLDLACLRYHEALINS